MTDHTQPEDPAIEPNAKPEDVKTSDDTIENIGGDDGQPGDDAAELSDLKERFLRLAAELENTRRRAAKEKTEAGQYAIVNFARDLINVADNFERALQAMSGADAPENDAVRGLVAGIEMTEKELITTLSRHGVQKVSPAGERFDPNLHQAVAQVPSDSIEKGSVVDVAQAGFLIGDRVLRAAMVTVSSGPAPTETPKPAGDTPENPSGQHMDTKA